MDRREMLGTLGAFVAAGGVAAAAEQREAAKDHHGDIHEKCAEACVDCEKHCNQGFHHCFRQVQAGKQEHAKAMHLLVDCGDICGTAGKLVGRMSPLMVHTCRACGECCEDTIAAVEKLQDGEMRGVLESLRRCRESCAEMVKAMGGHEHGRADGGH